MRTSRAILLAAAAALATATLATAYYSGRAGKVLTGAFVLGYDTESVLEATGEYTHVTAGITGDVAATATATLPRIRTAGRTTISVSGLATITTGSVVVVPWYGNSDSTGNWIWTSGPSLTIVPTQTDGTFSSLYPAPRQFVDTDGAPLVILQPISINSGTMRLFVRLN